MTALLRVLVVRGAPPPGLVSNFTPEHALLAEEGAVQRAKVPAYLARRKGPLFPGCPRLAALPKVLQNLIHCFDGRLSTEEIWAIGSV